MQLRVLKSLLILLSSCILFAQTCYASTQASTSVSSGERCVEALKASGHGLIRREDDVAVKTANSPETQKFSDREATILQLMSELNPPETLVRFIRYDRNLENPELRIEWIEGLTLHSFLYADANHKGIMLDVLTEGRRFLNPYTWDWSVYPMVEVPAGKMSSWVFNLKKGDKVTVFGPFGEFFAKETKADRKSVV